NGDTATFDVSRNNSTKINSIAFNPNGGLGTMNNQSFLNGSAQNINPNTFTRTGYSFKNWNTTANGSGTSYTNGGSITPSAAITLYAQWTAESYNVTYKANGGLFNDSSIEKVVSQKYEQAYSLPSPAPTKVGYTFIGWYTSSVDGSLITTSDIYKRTETQTLFAQWKANTYSVTFNGNGGIFGNNSATSVITQTFDTKWILPTENPSHLSDNFLGWSTAQVGTVDTHISTYDTFQNPSNITVYAQWTTSPTAALSYNANGGTGEMASQFFIHNTTKFLKQNLFDRAGYVFSRWNTMPNGTGLSYKNEESISLNSDITLYAQWTANIYSVGYDSNGGTEILQHKMQSFGQKYNLPLTPTKKGYAFVGWFTAPTAGSKITLTNTYDTLGNQTLYAQWIEIKATFVNLSKTKVKVKRGKSITLQATVYPTTALKGTVTWSSSNTKLAKVSKTTGKVTINKKAKKGKKVTITARSAYGKIKKCIITIK
ncbi:MAG: InlB B-repeat-containing protein, partial [Anaerovoracaceae bacterium]